MKFLILIPARYASTRFPGKPLALIHEKPMVQHVYERCSEVAENVFVATDDDRIANAVEKFGGKVVMTSATHPSGTDRCAEAARILSKTVDFDVVINVQGDEPFLKTEQVLQIMDCFANKSIDIATLVTPITSPEVLFDTNKVKCVRSIANKALYFSRHPVPFQRDIAQNEWLAHHAYFMHLGMYAFKKEVLQQITQLSPSKLEIAEKLEQLRWLENGFSIIAPETEHQNFGIDSPQDLEQLLKI